MFNQKKGKACITPGAPQFYVRYVGKTEVFTAAGTGCTHRPVQKVWDASVDEKHMDKMALIVNAAGITLTPLDAKHKTQTLFDIKDISYCCAETPPHDGVFAWICKNAKARRLECHVVLCTSSEKAQALALVLSRAFQIAYKDWKTHKEKTMRMKQNGLPSGQGGAESGSRSADEERKENGVELSASEQAILSAALEQMNMVEEEEFPVEKHCV